MTIFRNVLILVLVAGSSACTNLSQNLQDPAIWQRMAEINDHYSERQRQVQTGVYPGHDEVIDLTGEWSFRHNGKDNTNRIRHGHGGIMVIPANDNRPVYYQEVGLNLYQSREGATYQFTTIHNGQWRSNDKRNMVINLRRTAWQ